MDSHKFTTAALYCNYLAATWLVTLRTFAPHHLIESAHQLSAQQSVHNPQSNCASLAPMRHCQSDSASLLHIASIVCVVANSAGPLTMAIRAIFPSPLLAATAVVI